MAQRIWAERLVTLLLPVLAVAIGCGEEDAGSGDGSPSCPGASTACPDDCLAHTFPALTAAGCLEPEIASCRLPKLHNTKDAGCVKRDADERLFQVPGGDWPSLDGFEECTNVEIAQVMNAPQCP